METANAVMEISVRLVKQDVIDYLRHFYFRRYFLQGKIAFLKVGVVILSILIFPQYFNVIQYLVFLIGFTAIAIVLYKHDFHIKLKQITATFFPNESGMCVINYVLTSDGIIVEQESKSMLYQWREVIAVDVRAYGVYIALSNQAALILPERFFRHSQKEEFLDEVDKRILQVRRTNPLPLIRPTNRIALPKKNPSLLFYAFSLLSFVPLLGLFIGGAVILFGRWEYRNKFVVAIGAAGMLFTVGLYSCLIFTQNRNDLKRGKIMVDEVRLNKVVEALENYKVINGSYPERLEDLPQHDKQVDIYDPLVSEPQDRFKINFNYKHVGTGYTIFSSGFDQTPNTADDIYPTENGEGLIKK